MGRGNVRLTFDRVSERKHRVPPRETCQKVGNPGEGGRHGTPITRVYLGY
jgi:hypothetical protein